VTVAQEHARLKLGKRASFVKTHLRQLPRVKETWEADFRALPKPAGQTDTHYLGLAVALPRGDPLVYLPVEYTPTVNDLADLLADAMRRPLTGSARRPAQMHFRANPRWDEWWWPSTVDNDTESPQALGVGWVAFRCFNPLDRLPLPPPLSTLVGHHR
jgi:hypothetical protein